MQGKHCFLRTCAGLFWWTNLSENLPGELFLGYYLLGVSCQTLSQLGCLVCPSWCVVVPVDWWLNLSSGISLSQGKLKLGQVFLGSSLFGSRPGTWFQRCLCYTQWLQSSMVEIQTPDLPGSRQSFVRNGCVAPKPAGQHQNCCADTLLSIFQHLGLNGCPLPWQLNQLVIFWCSSPSISQWPKPWKVLLQFISHEVRPEYMDVWNTKSWCQHCSFGGWASGELPWACWWEHSIAHGSTWVGYLASVNHQRKVESHHSRHSHP